MKYFFAAFVILLTTFACASGGKVMTPEQFSEVSVGMTGDEVSKKFGSPYSIKNLGHGDFEYIYIEKVTIGEGRVLQEKHYLILFRNGRVTSTKTEILNQPAYQRNSYDMQTSYNEEENSK